MPQQDHLTARLVVDDDFEVAPVNNRLFGSFVEHLGRCVYTGIYEPDHPTADEHGFRKDVIDLVKELGATTIRYPGGNFVSGYRWEDGIGPKETRKRMVNTNWGGVVEDNSFGTHEFMELCRQIGCEPYVNANVGSGTVREMAEWVEYMNSTGDSTVVQKRWANGHKEPFNLKYLGVGNENWGCGGNMRPSYYADLYRRFQTYVRDYGDNHVFRIVCGPGIADDYNWTEEVMRIAGNYMNGLSLHYYTVPGTWEKKTAATGFDTNTYYETIRKALYMDELITRHTEIMSHYDPEHKVGLIVDEWGTWFDVEPGTNPGFLYQLNTMRDAMVAALTLNIFNKHADRVQMANIAQTVNVLQAVILTEGDKMVLTPTYHVFKMYKDHQQNMLIGSYLTNSNTVECEECSAPQMIESASVDDNGTIYATVTNISATKKAKIKCQIADTKVSTLRAEILTGDMHDKNDFSNPDAVQVRPFDGVRKLSDGFVAELPPCSVVKFVINEK